LTPFIKEIQTYLNSKTIVADVMLLHMLMRIIIVNTQEIAKEQWSLHSLRNVLLKIAKFFMKQKTKTPHGMQWRKAIYCDFERIKMNSSYLRSFLNETCGKPLRHLIQDSWNYIPIQWKNKFHQ